MMQSNMPLEQTIVIAGASLLALCIYGILLVLYRITFHPLAKFPGSFIAGATQWYEFYHDVVRKPGGQYMFEMEKMHDIYGPIVRVTPNEVHIRDPDFYTTLYAPGSRRDRHPSMAKMTGIPMSSFGTVGHDLHKIRRAPNGVMFSHKAVHGPVQEILTPEVEVLSRLFEHMHKTNEVRELRALFLGLVSVFSSQYYIGSRVDFLDDQEKLESWFRAIEALPKGTPFMRQFPWITPIAMRLPRWLQAFLSPHLAQLLSLHDLMRSKATEYLADPIRFKLSNPECFKKTDLPPTIFHAIERSNLPPEEKSFDRLWQEGFNLFIGGLDTTSRTMAFVIYYLCENPDILKEVRDELDRIMPDPKSQVEYKVLEKLPILTAVIKETLRCMELVTGRIPVICETDLTYQNYKIPSGTTISMSINDTLLSPRIFPNPHAFHPHRWLTPQKTLHTTHDASFIIFSRGPRACQGQEVSWAVMYRGLATILRRFEIEMFDLDYERDVKVVSDCFFREAGPEGRGLRARVVGVRG